MPTIVQFRRGTTAQNNAFTGATGEISVDTTDNRLVVHDGSTAGGSRLALASETIFRVIADDSTGIYLQGGTDELRISGGNGISTSTDSGGSLTVSLDASDSATFNGGVVVDNITIDGTEIDLSSGDLTLDVAGDIVLDAGGDEVIFKDGSTNVGHVSMDSDNLTIKSLVADKDIIFQGNDDSSAITALTLDMSAAGAAAFNSTVTATGFIIGSADINEADLEQIDGLTAGTVAASKAVVVDSNKDISSFRNLTATGTVTTATLDVNSIKSTDSTHIRIDEGLDVVGTLKVQEITSLDSTQVLIGDLRVQNITGDDSSVVNINDGLNVDGNIQTTSGNITAGGSFIIGSADMNETDLEKLDGITDGTVAANKAVVVDSNKDIGSFRNITATGATTSGTFVIGSADINETDLEQIDGLTAGTVAASKAVVVDSNKDIASFRNLTATGTITTADVAASGNVQIDGNLTVSGTTTSVNTTNLEIQDALIELNKNNSGGSDVDAGIYVQRGSAGNNAAFYWNEGDDKFKAVLTTSAADATSITDSSAATIVANLQGDVTGNADTATEATNVTVSANNTANESVFICFVDGATGTQGVETDTDLTYNPSTNVIASTASAAQYSDLAELYSADNQYEPGTVVSFGGDKEITKTSQSHDSKVAGVVSTAPAYLMNSKLENGTALALNGRVPCKVVGTINKGDLIVSSDTPGVAQSINSSSYTPGCVIGKALEAYDSETVGTIEVVVGRL